MRGSGLVFGNPIMTTANCGSEENTLKMERVMPVGSTLTRMEKSFRDSGGEGGIRTLDTL